MSPGVDHGDDLVRGVARAVEMRLRALVERCDASGVDAAEMIVVFERGIEWTFEETERWVRRETRSTSQRAAPVA